MQNSPAKTFFFQELGLVLGSSDPCLCTPIVQVEIKQGCGRQILSPVPDTPCLPQGQGAKRAQGQEEPVTGSWVGLSQ